ncbi:MAG: hypothetical protein GTO40_26500 [Deltaproteobacteria bacterium]|nr:hypothetical protein [Deltaproteobacteria bacterium]
MRLSLIGMSGSGKSYWSKRLAEHGFKRFCCDDLIAAKLAPELVGPDGAMLGLGEWMGFPYQSQYKERESKYLACEIEVLTEILEYLENHKNPLEENTVVDTTGSVIYTGEEILKKLRQNTRVIYLSTPPEIQDRMLEAYVANPPPVLWRGVFSKGPDETTEDALARCYPILLSSRRRLYERYADVDLDHYTLRKEGFDVSDLLNLARGH